jgi:hypothetical protein
MTERDSRRRWFQLHLSTCVVLMFVAGSLVWANVRTYDAPGTAALTYARGWPCIVQYWIIARQGDDDLTSLYDTARGRHCIVVPSRFDSWGGAANAAVALAILITVAFVLEFLIRLRRPPA